MVYQYIACNEAGEIVKGKLSALNEDAATEMLAYAGYRTVNLKPFVPFFSLGKLREHFFFSTVKQTDIILFCRQLALLLESGINISTALELLENQSTNHSFKNILREIIAELRGGSQLSTAMGHHPEIFSPICCQSLKIGEQTGGMEVMLRQVADHIEKEINSRKSIKSALTMPLITAGVAVIVIGILVVVVLPAFSNLYTSLGAKLPLLTRLLLDMANGLKHYGVYIIIGLLFITGISFAYVKTPDGRRTWHKILLNLPLLGRINHLNELSRCCRSISLLYRAGLPLPEIMPLIIDSTNNKLIAEALINVQQDMLKGQGLAQPMSANPLFLPMMVQMVKVGEETGNLDATVLSVSQSYETEAVDKTRSLIGMIQPAMTLFIAGVVGLVAMSMVSAMYSIYGQAF